MQTPPRTRTQGDIFEYVLSKLNTAIKAASSARRATLSA